MIVLTTIVCLSLIISAVARWFGASRWVAVLLPTFPPFFVFIYYAIRHDIDFGPHGGIVPAWIVAGIVMVIVAVVSFLAAIGFGGRRS